MVEKTAESIKGTWAKYFEELSIGYWSPETAGALIETFKKLYGGFHRENIYGEKILELGIGSGAIAIPLVEQGFKVVGIDNDKEALLMAESNKQFSDNPEAIQLLLADLYNKLPFKNNSFDACVSYGLLEHFKKEVLTKLIQEQLRVAPVIVTMMPINTNDTLKTYKATGDPAGEVDDRGIFRRFLTKKEWDKYFESIGLETINSKRFSNFKEGHGAWDMAIWALKRKSK